MPPLTELRKRVKPVRLSLGLTLREVSEATGLSLSYMSDIERGRRKSTLETLDKVFDYLGISGDDPLTQEEKMVLDRWNDHDYKGVIMLALDRMKNK